ncbi:MAG: glycosyltransferase family 39 protein [Anaerolineae bacterium]|nr:glycosyltransferase family 39 protein [Anaerolineae bacterium]
MIGTLERTQSMPRLLLLAQQTLLSIAALLMALHLAVYFVYAANLIAFPFDYDQGEGFELNDTVLLSQFQSPYRNNEVFPFYASNYPPLYHVILVPFAWLFGAEYWYGRLVSFLATLITAIAIGYAVQRATRQRLVATLSGCAYLASNYIYHIGPLFRQHISMVMFETLAVVTIATVSESERPRRLIALSLALLLAAGYTKQLAVATVAAVFIWLFLRGVRRAIAWAIPFAAIAGGIFLLIDWSTGGQWWLNVITANVNQYILGQYTGLLRQFIGLHGALLILAVLMVVYELYLDRLSVYSVWFVAAMLISVLAGKWGAGDSYFATAIAGTCILAGIFAGRTLNNAWRLPRSLSSIQRVMPVLGVVVCAAFVLYGAAVIKLPLDMPVFAQIGQILGVQSNTKFPHFYDSAGWTMGYAIIGQIPTAQDIANGWRIVEYAKADPRPILSEEAAFSFRSGKPVVTNPTQLLNLYNNNTPERTLYDPSTLIAMIEEQAFGVVILRREVGQTAILGFYPPPVLAAIERAYELREAIPMNGHEYTVLLPRPDWKKP